MDTTVEDLDGRFEPIDEVDTVDWDSSSGVKTDPAEIMDELKNKAMVNKKPSHFGLSKKEMLNKAKTKYQKGQISKAVYESIEEKLNEP